MLFSYFRRTSHAARIINARQAIQRAAIETLEARQMLAFTAHVNFQPGNAATPSGYVADSGASYNNRGNGLTYGWKSDTSALARDRNSSRSPDQRYDTLDHLSNTSNWQIEVPNGTYTVHIVAGDANNFDSTFKIAAEGKLVVDGTPTTNSRWVEGTTSVTVTDGKLTINSVAGANNNKLCFIDITDDGDPEPPPPPPPPTGTAPATPKAFLATATNSSQIALEWDDASNNETGFKIERRTGTGGTWAQIATVGANTESYLDSSLASNTYYQYRIRSYNNVGNSGYSNIDSSTTKAGSTGLPSSSISWSTKTHSLSKRAEAIGGVVNGKLYVLGGFYIGPNGETLAYKTGEVYNPATNKWTPLKDMPEKLTHAQGVVDGSTIWFVGGYVGDHPGPATDHVWKYDAVNDSWSRGPDLPEKRGSGGAALLGRELHFFGGMDEARTVESGDHYVLNLDNQSAGWVKKASLLNPRNHTAGASLNGLIYCIGGQHDQEEAQDPQPDIEVYNPATDKWTHVADLPVGRSHLQSSTFTYGNVIIIIGGENGSGVVLRDVTAWDPATNKFTTLTRLPSARSTMVAGVLPDGRIVTATGNAPSPINTTWIGKFN